ncbi:hypothetical protein B0F90DRAFT_1785233 [Multifurca ochricompacta]|uniref:Uncharacterized protein n=1 Tax=Multifurca ochricompacta TaxID=376703 RepID=A0AAD4QEK1_9AGAM|nr:hypothetical protein B0F90DRAFT_1785233 [Multifurca ochricompacta]
MAKTSNEPVSANFERLAELAPSTNLSLINSVISRSPPIDTPLSLVEGTTSTQKKKKKKKSKKSAKSKGERDAKPPTEDDEPNPLVLRISRNKHWRYISSYHGPWLQLPIELLESLLILNADPATFQAEPRMAPTPPSQQQQQHPFSRMRDRGYPSLGDPSPPDSPRRTFSPISYPPLPAPPPGKPIPPPIDPGVFRSVTTIRRLIDEASELAVRASSGMSAAALGSIRGSSSPNLHSSPWALAQSLGMSPLGDSGGGRNVAMSAMRIHRLRALAVQKLAAAYRADEIASSVMVMQGGSVFEDIAERVLKFDPNDADAKYVHFFHEKIPSRQLAESTTTRVLDELIEAYPQRLELFRTRGIVRTFRDEYSAAVKDFTHALKEARALRKARSFHRSGSHSLQNGKGRGDKRRKEGKKRSNGQAPPNGTSEADGCGDASEAETLPIHPSVLPEAPEPIEPQLLFLRGAAYLQNAIFLIEEKILKLEGIRKRISAEGAAELRLCYIQNGRYGGVEIGNPDGPLGRTDGPKLQAYRGVLADGAFREQIGALLKKSIRDHERFLAHFDALETPAPPRSSDNEGDDDNDIVERAAYAFLLSEALRPGAHGTLPPAPPPDSAVLFTTYHPLLVESHFSVLLCLLMLGDFSALLRAFVRAATVVDGLEGYPVFLPPRSMAQAEFVETLERLAGGWRVGVQPHSRARTGQGLSHANGKLAIEPSPLPSLPPPRPPPSGSRSSPPPSPLFVTTVQSPIPMSNGALFDPLAPSTSSFVFGSGSGSGSGFGSSASTMALMQLAPPSQVQSRRATPTPAASPAPPHSGSIDLIESLDSARIILAPVMERQRARAEQSAMEKKLSSLSSSSSSSGSFAAGGGGGGSGGKNARVKPLPINIQLHGPRVEIVLAWLAAVWLVELEGVALSGSCVERRRPE